MNYEVFTTEHFDKKSKKLQKSVKKEINKTIMEKLSVNPYSGAGNVGHMQADFKGLRRIRVGRGWRIYFAICEECRNFNHVKLRNCLDCGTKDDKSIVLFDVIHK